MYRFRSKQSLEERDKMEVKIIPGESEEQFLTRVGSLPIVNAAIGQLWSIYGRTKQSNGLVKFTLETAETGAKVVIATAQPIAKPVLNKFERPIGSLNVIACNQLNKLEEAYPIITKPVDQVLEGTFNMYKTTLKPSVDSVYNTTITKSVDKVSAAKQYGADKISGVKLYSYQAVGNTCGKLVSVKNYGQEKITGMLQTEYGQSLVGKVDGLLDVTDQCIDRYLPEEEDVGNGTDEKEKTEVSAVETPSMPSKMINMSEKLRRRMYHRTVKQLQTVRLRSRETLEKLNFTVDLIQYAKDHMEGARGRIVTVGDKVKDIWTEINRPEDDDTTTDPSTTTTDTTTTGTDGEKIVAGQKIDNVTLERRAIATARHLTSRLKGLVGYLTTTVSILPSTVQEKTIQALEFSDHIYNVFSTTELKISDIPQVTLDLVKSQVTTLQDSLAKMADYLADNKTLQWLRPEVNIEDLNLEDFTSDTEEDSGIRYVPALPSEPTE